jgi:hypothetical protein
MAPPIPSKTWTIGHMVIPADVDSTTLHKKVMWNIKELLISMGFTASRSVAWNPTLNPPNGAWEGPSSGDLWVAWNYLRYGVPYAMYGTSWIRLDHPVQGQLLIVTTGYGGQGTDANWNRAWIRWSPSGSFTAGVSELSAPTAPDAVTLCDNADFQSAGLTNNQRVLHYMKSTDGKGIRLFQMYSNTVWSPMFFEVLSNPHPTFNGKVLASVYPAANSMTYGVYYDTSPLVGLNSVGTRFSASLACEGALSNGIGEVWTTPDMNGTLPIAAIGAVATSPGPQYYLGDVADLWFGSAAGVNSGDTYSDHLGNLRKFAQFNHMIFPWDGTIPQTA